MNFDLENSLEIELGNDIRLWGGGGDRGPWKYRKTQKTKKQKTSYFLPGEEPG